MAQTVLQNDIRVKQQGKYQDHHLRQHDSHFNELDAIKLNEQLPFRPGHAPVKYLNTEIPSVAQGRD